MIVAERPAARPDPVRAYWNSRIHDMEMAKDPPGTLGFFDALDEYRYDKLRYLERYIDFPSFSNKRVIEVGCGIGTDLVRFARHGARMTGVDLSETAIDLAKANARLHGVEADLRVMDGAALEFADGSFDAAYAHGVIPYAAEPARLVAELCRVLKPGGTAILMSYNSRSWLAAMSRIAKVAPEHADAPVFRPLDARAFSALLAPFQSVTLTYERFPVRSRLHKGWKGAAYNALFVRGFHALPHAWVRRTGWHLLAKAVK